MNTWRTSVAASPPAHHLYRPLNVDLALEAEPLDLVDDHVDDDEGARAPDPRRAVHHEGTHRRQQQRVGLVALNKEEQCE